MVHRAYGVLDIKSIDDDKRIIEGVASTITVDRMDDIVEPRGAVFKLPLPFLWQHDSHEPVGHVIAAKVSDNQIAVTCQFAQVSEPPSLKEELDRAWAKVKAKLVRGLSIGFNPIESADIEGSWGRRFIKWEWLELSAVTVPANQDASITTIRSIDRKQRAAPGQSLPPVILTAPPGASGKSLKPEIRPKEGTMKTIAEQITALEGTRAAKSARMQEVMQKSMDDGRSTDAAERDEFDSLEQEVEALDGDLKRLRSLEKSAALTAKPVGEVRNVIDAGQARGGAVAAVAVKTEEKLDKGIAFARFAMCIMGGKGNLMQSHEIAKARFGESHELAGLTKAAVAAGTTTNTEWAGALVDLYQRYTGDFVEFLRPQTIIGKFGVGGIPSLRRVPFNIQIAGQISGGSGYWVGEGQPKPLTRFGFSTTNLRWAKVANIAVLTEEQIRFSNPSAEALVRDALAAALIERLDIDFVDPNKAAVTDVSPASITNGVTPIASTGNDADAIREDVALMMAPFINASITPTNGVWIMSSLRALRLQLMRNGLGQREFPDISMMGGRFEGLPVIVSDYATSDSNGDDVVLVNASDIWLADDGQVVIDASREASLEMSDAPTVNSGIPTAASLVSMFQTNSVALRAERWINWQKRRTQAVQMLGNVNWGEPGAS